MTGIFYPQLSFRMKRNLQFIPLGLIILVTSYAFLSMFDLSPTILFRPLKGYTKLQLHCCSSAQIESHSENSALPEVADGGLVSNLNSTKLYGSVNFMSDVPVTYLVSTKKMGIVEKEHTEVVEKTSPVLAAVTEKYRDGFSINEDYCVDHGLGLRVVILITSSCTNENQRLAIRQTWGHYGMRKDILMRFFLGQTLNKSVQERLEREQQIFGDLIQGKFLDSYKNLTLKSLYMLEWLDVYCYNAMFVLKTDDDMYINIPQLIAFISQNSKAKRTIFGRLAVKWRPMRNKLSKYYLPYELFKEAFFPKFVTGPAYLLTGDIIRELNSEARKHPLVPLEDVYITGLVADRLKISRVGAKQFKNQRSKVLNFCEAKGLISIHGISLAEQFELWKMLSNSVPLKCGSKK